MPKRTSISSRQKMCTVGLVTLALNLACKREVPAPPPLAPEPAPEPAQPRLPAPPPLAPVPLGLPEMAVPPEAALTAEKVELGKLLFFDKRLSSNGSASCEHCHQHDKGWTDGLALSTKVDGSVNTRHSPTLYNVGFQQNWYWDGRATDLDKQVLAAWKGQMSGDPDKVATQLADIPEYKLRFDLVFGSSGVTGANIAAAIAAFVRTLYSGDSAWDRYEKGDATAVSPDAIKGFEIFINKARCSLCHVPPLFTDLDFHNIGIGMDAKEPDLGRFNVTKDPAHTGAFKTPSLRSITKSGPYFHDGSAATLEDAVRVMLAGGKKNKHLDPKLKPVKLSATEFHQLLTFLRALESTEPFERPVLP